MRILLPIIQFPPDVNPTGVLMAQLCEGLTACGHEVSVITAFPHYENFRIWQEYRGKLVQRDGLCQKLFILPRSIESMVLMLFAERSRSVRSQEVGTQKRVWANTRSHHPHTPKAFHNSAQGNTLGSEIFKNSIP